MNPNSVLWQLVLKITMAAYRGRVQAFHTGNGGKPGSFQAIREDEGDDSPDDDGEDDVDDSDLESLHRYPHTIQVQIVRAEGLTTTDLGGASDPFVELMVDDRHNTQDRAATISENLNQQH